MEIVLSKLLEKLDYQVLQGTLEQNITDIIYDSRKVEAKCAFVCLSGANVDGHKFAKDAAKAGATAIIVEKAVEVPDDITVIQVDNTRIALSYMAAAYFDYPAQKMITVGITGTKGKTTTSHMIKTVIEKAGERFGMIGTNGAFINDKMLVTHNTTPESYELQKFFAQMVEDDCKYMVMEVSSQGLKLDRTAGIEFDLGVFENITPDHIGPAEHKDFEEYLYCKSLLFKQCKIGIFNCDDPHWEEVAKDATCEIVTFGTKEGANLYATDIRHVTNGGDLSMEFHAEGLLKGDLIVGLPGRFNVFNAMCAAAVCVKLGFAPEDILHALEHVKVKGRVEPMPVSDEFSVLIDYAHNEVSSRSVLTTLREYEPGRIVSIFGCGGNRSRDRRFTMGEAIGELSDLSIITEDNSRFEDVNDIMADIEVGMKKSGGEYIMIADRQEAINYAIANAKKGDMIVLLGKGHEDYREVKGVQYHYSEREAVANAMKKVYGKEVNISD